MSSSRLSTTLPLVLLLAVGLAAPRPASAQSYAEQVWQQLQAHYQALDLADYQLQNYVLGTLSDGGENTWTFYFDADTEYVITGACDEDCTDLDISVLAANGNVLISDTATDDYPVLYFQPGKSGRYSLKLDMYACAEEPCYFGFGIFK